MDIYPPLNKIAAGQEIVRDYFKKKKIPYTEESLINLVTTSTKKYDIYWSTIGLREVGSKRCIQHLKPLIYHTMQDVKCTSMLTIAILAGSKETEFFAAALLDSKFREKGYALWAIYAEGDSRAVPAVVEYLKKLKKRSTNNCLHHDVVPSLLFLAKFENCDTHAHNAVQKWLETNSSIDLKTIETLSVNSEFFSKYFSKRNQWPNPSLNSDPTAPIR